MRSHRFSQLILFVAGITFLNCVSAGAAQIKDEWTQERIKNSVCIKKGMKYGYLHGIAILDADKPDNPMTLHSINESGLNVDKIKTSPDGSKVLFLECTEDKANDCLCTKMERMQKRLVYQSNEGANRVVVGEGNGGFMEYPNWSPDGTKIVYVGSPASNPLNTDLFIYGLGDQGKTNITNTPCLGPDLNSDPEKVDYCMESDNFWNTDGTITVIRNKIVWRNNSEGKIRPKVVIPSNIFEFPIGESNMDQLTFRGGFKVPGEGDSNHCCFADPKRDYDSNNLVFGRFSEAAGDPADADIIIRNSKGQETDLSHSSAQDLYPLWSQDNRLLYWTRYKKMNGDSQTSFVIHDHTTGKQKIVPIYGETSKEIKVGDRTVEVALGYWSDWYHGHGNKILVPVTMVVSDSSGQMSEGLLEALEQELNSL